MEALIQSLERYATDLEAAADLPCLPEGDLGWRYNTRATAETIRAIIAEHDPAVIELPGVNESS